MTNYNVRLRTGSMLLAERDIAVLFRSGAIQRQTPCSEAGKERWRTIDEMFPLLKYEGGHGTALDPAPLGRGRPVTSAILSGRVCCAIELGLSWCFPMAHVFFVVAFIMAIIAMAGTRRAGD